MKLPPEHFRAQAERKQPTRFGEKLMQQMGWEQGQGLGRDGQGRKEHIRVKKKDEREGIGSGGGWNWGVKWWEQVFDEQATSLLQKAAQQTGTPVAQAPVQSSPDSGTVPASPVPSPQPAAVDPSLAAVDIVSTLSGADMKKRKHSKRLSSDSAPHKAKRRKQTADAVSEAPSEAVPSDQKISLGTANTAIFGRQWAALEPGIAIASRDSSAVKSFKNTPKENWWGAKRFLSAGQLDGLQRKQPRADKRQEFSEQDQTDLYNQLHDNKSSGRGGLGKNAAPQPGVVRKSKFEGTRVVFDTDDAEEGRGQQTPECEAATPRIKYKKLATSVLQQAPLRKMKCSKLEKLVHALIAESHGLAVAQQCQQQASLRAQVSKSRQFAVAKGVVSLVEAV